MVKKLTKEEIKNEVHSFLKENPNATPEELTKHMIVFATGEANGEEFDFITSIRLIESVQGTPYENNSEFLKILLGERTFNRMALTGFISSGGAITAKFASWSKLNRF